MSADMAAEQARIVVIAAAAGIADDQLDCLSGIEIGNLIGAGGYGRGRRGTPTDDANGKEARPPKQSFSPRGSRWRGVSRAG